MKLLARAILIIMPLAVSLAVVGCGEVAPTTTPSAIYESSAGGSTGTTDLQVQAIYPDAADIPIDTEVVIVFTKAIDDVPLTTVESNISITGTGVPAWSITDVSADKRVVRIGFVTDLFPLTAHNVTVDTGITDIDGNPLDAATVGNFTTGTDTSSLYAPAVVAVLPANGSTVIIDTGAVYAYFSKNMDPATVTGATFTILPDVSNGVPGMVDLDPKIFKLDLNTLTYGQAYTLTLTTGITDSGGTALPANYVWTFTAETDPDPPSGALNITSFWVTDVAEDEATVNWVTDLATDDGDSSIDYGTGTAYGSSVVEGPGGTSYTVHSRAVTGLSAATRYYYRITSNRGADTDQVTGSFTTLENTGTSDDTAVSDAAGDKTELTVLQKENTGAMDGSGYVFWLMGADIYAQYFDTDGLLQWTGNGDKVGTLPNGISATADGNIVNIIYDTTGTTIYTQTNLSDLTSGDLIVFGASYSYINEVSMPEAGVWQVDLKNDISIDDGNNFTAHIVHESIRVFSDSMGGSIIAIQDSGNGFYVKHVYDSAGLAFNSGWAGNTAGGTGLNFGAVAGYTGAAADIAFSGLDNNVYPGFITKITPAPGVATPLTTEMNGYSSNQLVFDRDLDFTTLGSLSDGDLVLKNLAWADFAADTESVTITGYTDDFSYYFFEDLNFMGNGENYLLLDSDTTVSTTADGYTINATYVTTGTTIYTTTDISAFVVGDMVVNDGSGEYGYITAVATPEAGVWQADINNDISTIDDTAFTAYQRLEGQPGGAIGTLLATEAINNPLWDDDADFSSVAANDIVLNSTDDTHTTVSTAPLNNKSLELSTDIMEDNDEYWIVRFADSVTLLSLGDNDTTGVRQLLDSTEAFATTENGDLVYNVSDNRYAVVTDRNPNVLGLSRDIFTATGKTYIVLESDEPLLDAGFCTSAVGNQLNDTNADFVNAGIQAGDYVYHYDGSEYDLLRVTSVLATQLTLDGAPTSGEHYYIVQPRMLFAWEDGNDILGTYVRLRDGTNTGVFNICTHTNQQKNVHTTRDASGNVFVIYEDSGGSIYGKRLNGNGGFEVGTDHTTQGNNIGTGTILDVRADGSGNIYLLYDNGVNVLIRGWDSTLAVGGAWGSAVSLTTSGSDAVLYVDTAGRPVTAYSDGSNDLYVRGLNADGSNNFTTQVISTGSYGGSLSLTGDMNDGAIVSWMDGRFYATLGYAVMAQAVDSFGLSQWDADSGAGTDFEGINVGVPGIIDPADLLLKSLFYNDTALPWGGIFIWIDYRNGQADLYYDTMVN